MKLGATLDEEIKSWKNIIASLCTKAPNTTVRDCLRCYDTSKPSNEIKKIFEKNFKKEPLLRTLEYLTKKIYVPEKIKKDEIIDALIMKVKNFFPDICQIWQKRYTFELGENPFLACHSCGQEVHSKCYFDLLSSMNLLNENGTVRELIFNIPGFHYLCAS